MAEREACADVVASVKAELREKEQQSKVEIARKNEVVEEEGSDSSEYEEVEEEVVEEVEEEEVEEEEEEDNEEEQSENDTEEDKDAKDKLVEEEKTTSEPTTNNKPRIEAEISKSQENLDSKESKEEGESLLLPLLQGLLHKNTPQIKSQSANQINSYKTANSDSTSGFHSSFKGNKIIQQSKSDNKKNSSSMSNATHHVEDSGTESGEDLRLIAAGLRDSIQIHSMKDQSDSGLIAEVTTALTRLEQSLKEGKDLKLDTQKRNALLTLVGRLQTGLVSPEKITAPTPAPGQNPSGEEEASSPEVDERRGSRSGHQRFAKRRSRASRHTVGVSREELADARRYIEEMAMIGNMSNCTTPESSAITPPEFTFPVSKPTQQPAAKQETPETSNLYRPNQFVPSHLKDSALKAENSTKAAQGNFPGVQLREKKPKYQPMRQSANVEENAALINEESKNKRPLSESYTHNYSKSQDKQAFAEFKSNGDKNTEKTNSEQEQKIQEKNLYNKTHHAAQAGWGPAFSGLRPSAYTAENGPSMSDSGKINRFANKKLLMKRANTIDIPKPMKYIHDMESDSEAEERGISSTRTIGLRGTVQVSVKSKPRHVVPSFQPKTENDHKFLAFIQKQSPTPGLGWNNPNKNQATVSNWSSKFDNIKNSFETGAVAISGKPPVPTSSARNFWKKAEASNNQPQNRSVNSQSPNEKIIKPPWSEKTSNPDFGALRMNQGSPTRYVPKPIPVNKFSHAPMSAFKPVEPVPVVQQAQFKPIQNAGQQNTNYWPRPQSSPTKMSFIGRNSQPSSPTTGLPWASQPKTDYRVLNMAATKFESKSPTTGLQRHKSFKDQEVTQPSRFEHKRPSLPNTSDFNNVQVSDNAYSSNQGQQTTEFPRLPYICTDYTQPSCVSTYTPEGPPLVRQDSLTNPEAEPLILTSERPIISPNIPTKAQQPSKVFDYPSSPDSTHANQAYVDTSDEEFDTSSMKEYKVEAKVMKGPISQQAVTVTNRTNRVGNEEQYGKNSQAAQSLLTVMKSIAKSKSPEKKPASNEKKTVHQASISSDGSTYKAPVVEPVFPSINNVDTSRLPLSTKQKSTGYQQSNPVPYGSFQPQVPTTYAPVNFQSQPSTPDSQQYPREHYQQNSAYAAPKRQQTPEIINRKQESVNYQQQISTEGRSYGPVYNNVPQRKEIASQQNIQPMNYQRYQQPSNQEVYRDQSYLSRQQYNQPIKQEQTPVHEKSPQETGKQYRKFQTAPNVYEGGYQESKQILQTQNINKQSKEHERTISREPHKQIPKSGIEHTKNVTKPAEKETNVRKVDKKVTGQTEVVQQGYRRSSQTTTVSASIKSESSQISTFNMPAYQKNLTSTEPQVYKSSAPSDTPDIVKSSLPKEDFPILKKYGPARPHLYQPNAYQYPLTKSESTMQAKIVTPTSPISRKFSEPNVVAKFVAPQIVETPSTPQPVGKDEIPTNIVCRNIAQFSSMTRKSFDSSTGSIGSARYFRPNPLSKSDSWHQIIQQQASAKPPSPKGFAGMEGNPLRRVKSGNTLAIPKMFEAGLDKSEVIEKQKTVAAYFSGQKSPNSLSRNSSQTNIAETTEVSKSVTTTKKTSINRVKTNEKSSISNHHPGTGLARSQTMPHMSNISLLDESNVEDAFEQLLNAS